MPIDPTLDPLQAKPVTPSESQARRAFAARNNRHDSTNADLSNIEMPSHWAVPWADLMMVMMVMFAVMLATNLAERDVSELFKKDTNPQPKQHVQPPPPKSTITQAQPQDDLRSKEKTPTEPNPVDQPKEQTTDISPAPQALEKADAGAIPIEDILRLSKNLVTEANLDDIDVVLTDNQSIKVSVRGNLLFDLGKADLKPEAISFLRDLSKIIAANNYQIEVAGHTDNFPVSNPAYPTNWELSAARAARVARYLIQYGNVEPGRFTVIGHSYYQPTVANDSLANKAKNRRVEIIITRYTYNP
ncbi:MAG TPA: OmpA family protein [Cellvibrio sp.]|nr:OmpA family protein [Cellvibrio sp.]